MIVNITPHFKRSYQNLPLQIQADFDKKIALFLKNPRDPKLKSHKLRGKLEECLSFYLKDGYRVLFEFTKPNIVNLLDAGPHDKYRNWNK